ncbi:MAG TPA: DUF6186 family protein [Acidimicrobiales bacterium]|nr:DUF6186 family protein [Acidimicrobiales bacterium]
MTRLVVLCLWGAAVVALLLAELASVRSGRRVAGVGELLTRLTASRFRLAVVFVGWMWLGWHFFAR